jgi:AICAR transformylase/IMP cyclohydrolase PurH
MKSNEGTISGVTRCKLALEAFKHTAEYDAAIYEYLSKQKDLTLG